MTDALINKYRPQKFEDVVGQDAAVRSLKAAVEKRRGQAFLFTGPSGVGKTTLARITAKELGCQTFDIIQVDAPTYAGVEETRQLTAETLYMPLSGSPRGVIVDEVHGLSKQSFQALLKALEEPPSYLYWFLCTTEAQKVPTTIRTRCLTYELKSVGRNELLELLDGVAAAEKMKVAEGVIDVCARQAGGSPRQALSNLAICAVAKSRQEAAELLRSAEESPEAFELARLLVRRASWHEAQELLASLKDVSPESVRHVVRGYTTKVVLGAKDERAAGMGCEILDAFSEPFHPADGLSPVVVACARLLLK